MILKSIKAVFLSNIAIQVIGFVSSFILKRLIAPGLMGIWNLVAMLTGYIQMLDLGTSSGSQREMPYYLGNSNLGMEKKVRETHLSVVLMEVAAATVIFFLFFLIKGNFLAVSFWFLYLFAPFYALSNRVYSYMVDCFQSRQEFIVLSRQNVYISLAGFVLTVLGAWLFGLPGLFAGFSILYVYRIGLAIVMARRLGFGFTIKFHKDVFVQLFKIGFPIQISGYLWRVFVTIDAILVTKWLGLTQLAFYVIGTGFYAQLVQFSTQLHLIFFQRMLNKYGKEMTLKSVSREAMAFFYGTLLVVTPFVCLSGSFLLPFLIRHFISNYAPANSCLVILLFGMFFGPQVVFSLSIYTLKKSLKTLIFYSAVALVVGVMGIYLFTLRERSIENVALGVLAGNAVLFLCLFFNAWAGVFTLQEKLKVLFCQLFGFLFTLAVYLGLEKFFPASDIMSTDLFHTLAKFSLSFVCCAPVAIYGLKVSDAWQRVKDEMYSMVGGFWFRIKMSQNKNF